MDSIQVLSPILGSPDGHIAKLGFIQELLDYMEEQIDA